MHSPAVSFAPPLPRRIQVAYATAEFGLNAAETALRLYLLKFYTDAQGLDANLAGLAFAIGLLWDAIIDPLMGVLSDRTAHRFGGRRFWLLVGAVLIAGGLMAVFAPPPLHGTTTKFAWLVFAGCLLNTGMSVVYVPYLAMSNEMTDDPYQRSVLFAWRFAAANLGAVLAVGLPIAVVGEGARTVDVMGTVAALIAAVVCAGACVTWTATKPRPGARPQRSGDHALAELLGAARNRAFQPLLLAYVVASAGVGINATTALHYYEYCLRLTDHQTQSLIATFLGAFTLGLPVWMAWSKRAGKLFPLALGATICAFANTLLYLFLPPGAFVWALLIGGIGIGAMVGCVALLDSMLTDVVDHDTIFAGHARGGAFFGVWRFAQKVARAIAAGGTGFVLHTSGFAPNQEQSPATKQALTWLFGPGVGFFFLITAVILWRYRFDARKQRQVQQILARRAERS